MEIDTHIVGSRNHQKKIGAERPNTEKVTGEKKILKKISVT